jgi:glycosyltransferase involved in cell wall biosynthesis
MTNPWPRPRVVVLNHTAKLSGGELALLRLIEATVDDIDFHVILAEDGPLVQELANTGASTELLLLSDRSRNLRRDDATTHRMPWRTGADFAAYTGRIARRLRQLAPDVVHTNTLKAAFYGGVAARLAGRPCLWHIRDRIADDYLPAQAVVTIQALARVLPSAVVTDTDHVLRTLHLPAGRGHVIPSPIPAHTAARPDRANGSFRVAMIGRLAPWKGQEIFVRAFVEAFPGGVETAVLIGSAMFGEEAYEAHLRRLIDDLGASSRVQLLGFRRDIEEELTRADALVHASLLPEPFGQVILEGMAAGVPVVASEAGGPAEVITEGRDGLLTPPGDVHALAAALRCLRSDAGLRQRLTSGGHATAALFRPEAIGPRFVALYQAVGARALR